MAVAATAFVVSGAAADDDQKPSRPLQLRAIVRSFDAVRLRWNDRAEAVELQWRSGAGRWQPLARLSGKNLYDHSGLQAGRPYEYRIRTVGRSADTSWQTARVVEIPRRPTLPAEVISPLPTPAAPLGLVAVPIATSALQLSWDDDAPGQCGFRIERRQPGRDWIYLTDGPAGVSRYESVGLLPATVYEHRVRAFNDGTSEWTTVAARTSPRTASLPFDMVVSPAADRSLSPGDVVRLNDGQLLFVYVAGGEHAGRELQAARSADDGATWNLAGPLFAQRSGDCTEPSIVRMANGQLGLTCTQVSTANDTAAVFFCVSRDEGLTWSAPVPVTDQHAPWAPGIANRLLRLPSGQLVTVVQTHFYDNRERCGADVYFSRNNGRRWQRNVNRSWSSYHYSGLRAAGDRFLGATIAPVSTSELVILGSTEPEIGFNFASHSSNEGRRWEPLQPMLMRSGPTRQTLAADPDCSVLALIRNARFPSDGSLHDRRVLSLHLSDDQATTWGGYREVAAGPAGEFNDTPCARWLGDRLHVFWRHGELGPQGEAVRAGLRHRSFATEDLLGSLPPDPPRILGVTSLGRGMLRVSFSVPVDRTLAEQIDRFHVEGLALYRATCEANGKSVLLETSGQSPRTHELRLNVMHDARGRPFVEDVMTRFAGHGVEYIIDNTDGPPRVVVSGPWKIDDEPAFVKGMGHLGQNYLVGERGEKEELSARYIPDLVVAGKYRVYWRANQGSYFALDTPVEIHHAGGKQPLRIQQYSEERFDGYRWNYLGTYPFEAGTDGWVEIHNRESVSGNAILADGVRFVLDTAEQDAPSERKGDQ